MITHVKGKLVEKNPTYVVVECSGIGYHINISLTTYEQIKDEENIFLYTHLQIKEDSHSLFGFFENIHCQIHLYLLFYSYFLIYMKT